METRRNLICTLLLLTGCVDRQISSDDEAPQRDPTCMITPGYGHWNDGRQSALVNEWGSVGSVCLCLTDEELESKSRLEELNDLALDECQRIAALEHDFDWTDCEEYHESGEWLSAVYVAAGENAHYNYAGLNCDDGSNESGCSVSNAAPTRAPCMFLMLTAALIVRLRRTV